jgi:hypothetical protein
MRRSIGAPPLERQFYPFAAWRKERYGLRGERADTTSRQNDAEQIQRIRGRNIQRRFGWISSNRPQEIHGFRPSELLAEKAGDEAAAAYFTAGLHTAQGDEEISPGWSECLSREQIAEHDAPTQKELARKCFGAFLGWTRSWKLEQCPTTGRVPGHLQARPSFASSPFGIDECAKVFKTICRNESTGRKFPKAVLHLAGQQSGCSGKVRQE